MLAEHPSHLARDAFHYWAHGDANFLCYNFVAHRVKARSDLRVYNELAYEVRDHWVIHSPNVAATAEVARADVVLTERNPHPRHIDDPAFKVLEASRWYVPRPLAELILDVVQHASG